MDKFVVASRCRKIRDSIFYFKFNCKLFLLDFPSETAALFSLMSVKIDRLLYHSTKDLLADFSQFLEKLDPVKLGNNRKQNLEKAFKSALEEYDSAVQFTDYDTINFASYCQATSSALFENLNVSNECGVISYTSAQQSSFSIIGKTFQCGKDFGKQLSVHQKYYGSDRNKDDLSTYVAPRKNRDTSVNLYSKTAFLYDYDSSKSDNTRRQRYQQKIPTV